ncbi:WYL domain-containing protein [Actinoplanes sp. NPDC051861]|uniref:helix-turn-helix transcriptional regulator n=1 Tax=Actinoplanes sp. NPDC051861 TaxID=3155170 RepID=UPI00343773A0
MPKTSGRLLSLLSLLQARRDWPGALLAARLEVSPRTVRRDIDRLRELGYAIATVKGPDGGYRLAPANRMPPLLFDDDQAVAIAVGLRVAAVSGAGVEAAAARALNTLRQVMPSRLRQRIDALPIVPVAGAAPVVDTAVLTAVGAAVHSREILRFTYGPDVRRAEPHHLVTWGARWYLVAWDTDRRDWRTFRLDRLTPLAPAGPRFTPRPLDVTAFVISRFRGSAGGWPCQGEAVLDRPAAEIAPFVPDGLVEEAGPGRCRVVMGSWSWVSLAAAFGKFDADLSAVGPAPLVEAFARLAQRYATGSGR